MCFVDALPYDMLEHQETPASIFERVGIDEIEVEVILVEGEDTPRRAACDGPNLVCGLVVP